MLVSRTICIGLCVGALVSAVSPRARGAEPGLEAAFSRTSRLEGEAYAAGRRILERQGSKALPFLRQKAKSADWRVRYLALSLALRIERPGDVALWSRAFSGWDHEFTFRDDGTVHVQFDPREREFVEKVLRGDLPYRPFGLVLKKLPPGDEAVLGRETIPIVLDRMRESFGGGSAGDRRQKGRLRALEVLKHFADPDTAEALLGFYRRWPRERAELVVGGLARMGEPVLPILREAIRSCPTEWPDSNSRENRETRGRNGQGINRSAASALALGRIGDQDGALPIAEKLASATYSHQVEAFCEALGRLRTPEGMPVVFKQLVRTAGICRRSRGSHSSEDPDYVIVREAMLDFGETVRRFLSSIAREGDGIPERAIAGGLLHELDNKEELDRVYRSLGEVVLAERRRYQRPGTAPDPGDPVARGKELMWQWGGSLPAQIETPVLPLPLLAERAVVSSQLRDMRQLAAHRDHALSFDILADTLVYRKWDDREGPTLALLLAEIGDDRAIEVYRKLLGDRPTRYISTLVEGMLLLGSAKAAPVLEEIVRRAREGGRRAPQAYREAEAHARAALSVLRGDGERLLDMLRHEEPSVREIAARVMARRGDLRAIPALVKAAASSLEDRTPTRHRLSYDTRRARRGRHVSLRDAIVGLGRPALATLGRIREASQDRRERLLCESAALRISEPAVLARLEGAARSSHPGFAMHGGPGLAAYQAAGKQLAEAVGEEAIPLLEEVVAFDLSPPGAGIAIWALAEFKKARSIPVIVEAARTLRVYERRGKSIVAPALREFGDEGIEAAKKVPAPDPHAARYGGRARRHRVATETLALAKEAKGVESILEGLAQKKGDRQKQQYYPWLKRMKTYLELADKYHDERLVDAILGALNESPKDLWEYALPVLGAYDDERVVPTCVGYLGRYKVSGGPKSAVKALTRRLGTGVGEFLVDVLGKSKDPKVRAGAAWGLGELVAWGGHDYWSTAISDMEGRKKAVTKTREAAMLALIDALGDPDSNVQKEVAEALVSISSEYGRAMTVTDKRAVGPLIAWVRSKRDPPGQVVDYLVASGDPSAAPAMLAAYRASGFRNDRLLNAIGALEYTAAVPDIAKALDRRIRDKDYRWGIPELEALGKLGPAGIAELLDAFRNCPDLVVRVGAAAALGEGGYRDAFGEIHALFEDLVAAGRWHPGLKTSKDSRGGGYQSCVNSLAGALASLDAKRAYPILSAAVVRLEEEGARDRLLWHLRRLEEADPTLRDLPVPLPEGPKGPSSADEGRLPGIPFLRACDLWRRALAGRQGNVPEDVRRELLRAGDPALAAIVDLCYPAPYGRAAAEPQATGPAPGSPTGKAVAEAVAKLADERGRDGAVRLLALGRYPPPLLDRLLATAKGKSLLYGNAIRRWRRQGPWFLEKRDRLLAVATTMLEIHWPIDEIRRFAIADLDRLGEVEKVEYHWSKRPLGPLLASIRYSPDPAERDLLAGFVTKARPGAREVAISVMKNGLKGRTRAGMADRWKAMPKHEYRLDWAAQLDPSAPAAFKQAMYAAPMDASLRRRLHEVVLDEATDGKLRDDILGFLWHFMGDTLARDRFAADLLSDDYARFRRALYRLTDTKFAYRGASIIPHLKRVLEGDDAKRRIATIGRMGNYLGDASIRLAAEAVAPFLVSKNDEERAGVSKTLAELQRKGWIDALGELARGHRDTRVREEAAKLLEDNPPRGRAAKPKPKPRAAPRRDEGDVF